MPPELCSAAWALGVPGRSQLAAVCMACLGLGSSVQPTGLQGSSSRSTSILFHPFSSSPFTEETNANTPAGSQVSVTSHPASRNSSTWDPSLQPAWSPLCFSNTTQGFFFPTAFYLRTEDWPSSDKRDRLTEGLVCMCQSPCCCPHAPQPCKTPNTPPFA